MGLAFTAPDRVRIGNRDVLFRTFNQPMKDGSMHVVEATSDIRDKHQERLLPSDLAGLRGDAIPKAFQIIIYQPEARSRGLDYVSFEDIAYGRRLNISVRFDFRDWSLRTNLIHFAEDFRALIERKLQDCQSARVEKDEYGVEIWVSVFLSPSDDCYKKFSSSDDAIFDLYKEALASSDQGFVRKLESPSPAGDTAGVRWWVRYVVVPLVSGATGAAAIVWALQHL